MNKFGFYECEFCATRYIKESQFEKHTCLLKERDHDVRNTKRGRFAFTIYKTWIETRGYQKPKRDTFIESRYYKSICRFADYYYETMLPDYKDFIKYVTKKEYLPNMWCMNEVYEEYIISFDDRVKPLKQAEITFKFIDSISRSADLDPSELFSYLYVSDIIKLIQCRRLSPWVLFQSKVFMKHRAELDADERIALDSMLNLDVWIPRFTANKRDLKIINGLVKELGL